MVKATLPESQNLAGLDELGRKDGDTCFLLDRCQLVEGNYIHPEDAARVYGM